MTVLAVFLAISYHTIVLASITINPTTAFNSHRQNMGLIGATKIGSRRVVQISAGFMLLLSVLGM
jgi:xanthine/uracil permease